MASSADRPALPEHSDPDPERPSSRPALLPAFEPLSSSPGLPRPSKRKHDGSPSHAHPGVKHYPTPVPTSSTSLLPSSPSRVPATRPGLKRTVSSVSERVPLGDVPSLELSLCGQPMLLGRSSNSSQYQLPASRLISRVHVKAWYEGPSSLHQNGRIIIECLGWNGMRVLFRGGAIELGRHDTFASSKPDQDILADIQDTRVMIRWPAVARKGSASAVSEDASDADDSPALRTPRLDAMPSSPPVHLRSPVSPSPRDRHTASSTFLGMPFGSPSSPPAVQVYEDHDSADEAVQPSSAPQDDEPALPVDTQPSQASASSSSLSSPDELSDRDEENDPIVHSFGPFGDNLLPRMASFRAVSPERRREPLRDSVSPRQRQIAKPGSQAVVRAGKRRVLDSIEVSPIRNHVINQLAYSRLHSLPLSTIMNNLPTSLKTARPSADVNESQGQPLESYSEESLRQLLDDTPCVGEIVREGKDAAGKQLEDEFYYVPEMDADTTRKNAVENVLAKPGLRAVRKQHKQYFWKRPRF